ncbi:MAG: PorV/PorQ family protein [Melioribacteraceae bacterium]|nr:PorV/PorQ family protein [Melioribacteraceae bacterium]MCF8262908.1 PorV/PorQ family protein [Melioribacteraceae bacterium]MCF8430396.1 PorV/PorQ family protein [Melioribacteraceae bacterium]
MILTKRNITKTLVSILLLTCSFVPKEIYSQKVGTTSFQFLKVSTNARATALGESFTAIAQTSESLFYNPAGIVNTKSYDVSVSHVDWFIDTKIYAASLSYNLGNVGVVGLFGIFADYGSIQVTKVSSLGFLSNGSFNPGLTGQTISPSAYMVGLSYARSLTDKFSFGFSAKYAGEDLILESSSSVLFDAGLTYDTGFKSIRLGAAVRQFGPEVQFVEDKYPLPQTFEVGISAYLIDYSDAFITNIPHSRLLFAYSIVHPRDYEQQQVIGMEYSYDDLVFIRGGYKMNFDEETITAGFGLFWNNIRFDYAYVPFGDFLDSVHRFSFGYSGD